MRGTDTIAVELPLQEFTCPITLEIPDQPVVASCCDALFELNAVKTLRACPHCRSKDTTFSPAPSLLNEILELIRKNPENGSINFPMDLIHCLIGSKAESRKIQNTIDVILKQHQCLYEHMAFNIDEFSQIIRENKLQTLSGERLIAILKNSSARLNQSGIFSILVSTAAGRLLLRQNLNVKEFHDEKLLCFGNALLSFESLKTQVNGMSILELLSMEISADLNKTEVDEARLRRILGQTFEVQYQLVMDELYERQSIEKEKKEFEKIFSSDLRTQFPRWLLQEEAKKTRAATEAMAQQEFKTLLSLARKQGLFRNTVTAEYQYTAHEAVNEILQQVVYGQSAKVREMLNRMKRENPILLKTVLTSVSTIPIVDYSGKKIENMTLLQAAMAANDVNIHADAARNDPDHQGMCEIIQSYFDESIADQSEITEQYGAVLKRSLRENYPSEPIPSELDNDPHELHATHRRAQEKNRFDFSKIIGAITSAGNRAKISGARDEVNAVLNRYREEGASFTESDVARVKPDAELNLIESFNRFREQFENHALSKCAVNPYDLLEAFKKYDEQFDNWTWDQRDLFVRQVIGFVQRYLSAADARIFAYGLYSAVSEKHKIPDHFDFRYDPGCCFYPISGRSCSGLGFDYMACGRRMCVRGPFFPAMGPHVVTFWKNCIEQKQMPVRTYSSVASSIAVPR